MKIGIPNSRLVNYFFANMYKPHRQVMSARSEANLALLAREYPHQARAFLKGVLDLSRISSVVIPANLDAPQNRARDW